MVVVVWPDIAALRRAAEWIKAAKRPLIVAGGGVLYSEAGDALRALVEADIARFKLVIGDGLRSPTDGRRATEVAIAVGVLNRMLDLGRPEYVRVA